MTKNILFSEVTDVLDKLENTSIPYLLTGSRALTFLNRPSSDIDIAVPVSSSLTIQRLFPQTNDPGYNPYGNEVVSYKHHKIEFIFYSDTEWALLYAQRKYHGKYTLMNDLHIIRKKIEMLKQDVKDVRMKHLMDLEYIIEQLS